MLRFITFRKCLDLYLYVLLLQHIEQRPQLTESAEIKTKIDQEESDIDTKPRRLRLTVINYQKSRVLDFFGIFAFNRAKNVKYSLKTGKHPYRNFFGPKFRKNRPLFSLSGLKLIKSQKGRCINVSISRFNISTVVLSVPTRREGNVFRTVCLFIGEGVRQIAPPEGRPLPRR